MRHYFLLVFIGLIHIHSLSQINTFELNGWIHGADSGTVSIWRSKTNDSTFNVKEEKAQVANGKFIIKGHLEYPQLTGLTFYSDKAYYSRGFFIDTGKQELEIHILDEELLIKSSAPLFNEHKNYTTELSKRRKKERKVEDEFDSLSVLSENGRLNERKDSLLDLLSAFSHEEDTFLLNYITENPESWVSLNQLNYFVHSKPYSPLYDTAFKLLDRKMEFSGQWLEINEMMHSSRQIQKGLSFPSMNIFDLQGNKLSLGSIKLGKYTLYDFWFSTCGPCLNQMERLKKIYLKWHDRGFEITGIATDYIKYENELKSVIKKRELQWPQYWDHDYSQSNKYSIIYYPTNFLLDRDGKVLARNIEPYQLDKFLEENLK